MHTSAALIYTQDAVSDRPKAVMLIFSACILELGFLWTGLMFARSGHDELRHSMKSHRALESGKRWMPKGFVVLCHGLRVSGMLDSILTLSEYCLKLCTGLLGFSGASFHLETSSKSILG